MDRQPRNGFTLIELLVVIAVIALLAALLFPVFVWAREKARSAGCTSNLRQLGMAVQQYMQDWDGGLPELFEPGAVTPEQFVSSRWYGHLMPYLRNRGILHCPADPVSNAKRAVSPKIPGALPAWADHPAVPPISYGINFWLQQSNEVGVAQPAQTVLLGDCAAHQCADAVVHPILGAATSCYAYANGLEARDQWSPFTGRAGQERHLGGSNLVFMDGHVKFFSATRFRKQWQGNDCTEYPLIEAHHCRE